TKIKRYTVLKSPHINKDSREQFEIRIHARMLDIVAATPDTVDSLTKLDLAPEVSVEVRAMGK
ncbi:30S ribosomal protein S10, partial [Salmonella enterica subsp. enterica serovar Mississippi]|nr:30S ribosomal protein S10 [Salmonella enterica subsp. enterica serovar Mississippi]MCW1622906.1 30S ribosomal protein S10 [Campylobacter jejuni]